MDARLLRRTVYSLLIALAAGELAGHILSTNRVSVPALYRDEKDPTDERGPWAKTRPEPVPTHGDNDRSRWDTVRALVDEGTYAIGWREVDEATGKYADHGICTEDGWRTIDKVLHPETHVFYSSKPPLLPTLVAGEYWLLKKVFGWSIVNDRWCVVRTILFTINWLPMIIYLTLFSRLVDWLGATDWGRLYVMAAAALATYMSPFLITFNNHTVAACTALFALYPVLRIWHGGQRGPWLFILAGFFAGFTACNELPAALFTAALGVCLLVRFPRPTLLFFVPAVLLPVAGLLTTNYLAIGRIVPAYSEVGSPWYAYEGSHWTPPAEGKRTGIDWAEEPKLEYAFHFLFGHHGLFSLSPIFLLSIIGCLAFRARPSADPTQRPPPSPAFLSGLTVLLTVVVVGFYVMKTNNYGGWTTGPRWLIWLTPFLLLTMLPAADWLGERRWGRAVAYALLALSVLSVTYRPWNPWLHPWLYQFLETRGWIHY
jgi:hypothetical protein